MLVARTVNEIRLYFGLPPLPVGDPRGIRPPEIGVDPLSLEPELSINTMRNEAGLPSVPWGDLSLNVGAKIWKPDSPAPQRRLYDPLGDGISEIKVISVVGSDKDIVNAARVSFDNDDIDATFDWKKDPGLIRYLINHDHGSPLEHNLIKFYITAPNFIIKQMLRHRIGVNFNEKSGRYTVVEDEKYYVPPVVRVQHKNNRQASTDASDDIITSYGYMSKEDWTKSCQSDFELAWTQAYMIYQRLLSKGVAKEQARGVLPIGQYSSLYITFNLRSLLHFAHLRTHEGAQYEIQQYAKVFLDEAEKAFPVSVAAFKDKHHETFGTGHYDRIMASHS